MSIRTKEREGKSERDRGRERENKTAPEELIILAHFHVIFEFYGLSS